MEQDKMREEFTAWLAEQEREQLAMGNERFTGTEIGCMGRAWEAAWQTSREAVVVVLPDWEWPHCSEVQESIEAAGIRTK